MCNSKEKLIYDIYVEGNLITNDLVELIQKQSKILNCEIYRGIVAPNIVLKVGMDINKYFNNKIMSFSKNFDIAKKFTNRVCMDETVFYSLKRDGYNAKYVYKTGDDSFCSKVIIRTKNQKSVDLYENYENRAYQREKEVLMLTKPLYIKSLISQGDTIIADCIDNYDIYDQCTVYM